MASRVKAGAKRGGRGSKGRTGAKTISQVPAHHIPDPVGIVNTHMKVAVRRGFSPARAAGTLHISLRDESAHVRTAVDHLRSLSRDATGLKRQKYYVDVASHLNDFHDSHIEALGKKKGRKSRK